MRRLNSTLSVVFAACVVLVCIELASAQLPSPRYIFADVIDQTEKPVRGAAAVVYDEGGAEVGGSITDARGRARLIENRYGTKPFIVRVIKPGYVTYEGVFETSGEYQYKEIKIKLTSASSPKPKASKRRRTSLSPPARKPKRRNYHAGKSTRLRLWHTMPALAVSTHCEGAKLC